MDKLNSKNQMTYQEAINAGYEMTGDGFWIPPQSKTFRTTIELDPASGECYMTIPSEVLERLNWTEGTQLNLTVQDDTLHIIKA
jgi:AbrB family looped-hinge helix DNA binding protein